VIDRGAAVGPAGPSFIETGRLTPCRSAPQQAGQRRAAGQAALTPTQGHVDVQADDTRAAQHHDRDASHSVTLWLDRFFLPQNLSISVVK
jgi:hypothetical protein